ncbi:hypothetical protein GOP47_0020175 [Adiantum capillus-veneris]|uniref:FAF domain-containing protein n=1 Tax=Adiantum capillus-veneris TaxID=13818 RepID=A0A9D4UCQ9_ADICA|nr:hypothetical protein GOP47_0020175 [Adiantum capillus-veneris]
MRPIRRSLLPVFVYRRSHLIFSSMPLLFLMRRKSGSWRGFLEETPSLSKSSAVVLRRHESVAMLPHMFSNLAVGQTHSEPGMLGKDLLKITLPCPGEPNCEANVSSAEGPEGGAEPLIGLEMQGASSSGSISILTSAKQLCDETMTVTDLSSKSPCLWDGDESIDDNAGPIPKIIEVSNVQVSSTWLKKPREEFLGAESSTLELEQDWRVNNSSCCAASNQIVASRTAHWDDWWSGQSEEFRVTRWTGEHGDTSKGEGSTPAMVVDVDEDASDEGYLVLDEQEDELEICSDSEAHHDTGDGGILEHVHHDAHNGVNEESPTDRQPGFLSRYKEDDIWSDEHFVSSQVKGFPPPISILANETHPGLPSHVPKTLWRSVKRNGRFVLQEVQARPREFFQATREYGRLRLQLVRPDSETTGSYTETASMEDKEGSLISRESVPGNSGSSLKVFQAEDCANGTPGASPSASPGVKILSQGNQSEDQELRGATHDNKDCANSSQGFSSLTLLFDQLGGALQQEHSGADIEQRAARRTSADAFLKEYPDQGESDAAVERSSVADYKVIVKEVPGERVYGEGFGCMSSDIMSQELTQLDVCNQASGVPHEREECYRQDYQHPRFSTTYGFDNISVLSPSQTLMQLPIQSAVR